MIIIKEDPNPINWSKHENKFRMKFVIPVKSITPEKAKEALKSLIWLYREDIEFKEDVKPNNPGHDTQAQA